MRAFALLIFLGAATAGQAQSVPEPIKARVNDLVAQCARAGGQLGQMTGQGQFVIPKDFTGDGRTDFVVSEGNFPCTGKPTLFRPDGLARVELWIGDGQTARLGFADRLLAYRILDGRPAKLQIARRAPACGGPARCGDELRWNAAVAGFDEVATDGRAVAARPATGAVSASALAVPQAGPAAAAGGPAAPAGPIPAVQAGADSRFKSACRTRYLAGKPQDTSWIDPACAEEWKRVTASQPMAELLLKAVPGGPGAAPSVTELRQRLAGVQWASRPQPGTLATGRAGKFGIEIVGSRSPQSVRIGWSETGADFPLDMPEALAARGAKLTLTRCEKISAGEGERGWSVALPGLPPFELVVAQRGAPTANALSSYSAAARVDGAPAAKGPTRCDPFW